MQRSPTAPQNTAHARASEPFVSLHPKDNFYQSVSFFPMPFALVTTVNEAGVTSIGPHSLAFPFDLIEHPSMMLISRASSNTATNLRARPKCALNFVEYDEAWLEAIVALGYPGRSPEEKMQDTPFTLIPSPSPKTANDPEFPLILKEAFQVYECEVDGDFVYRPHRDTAAPQSENFFALRIKDVLLKASVKEKLDHGNEFPDMPISYGFRGGNEFWFTRHGQPFHFPVPKHLGPARQEVYYMANKLDPEVRFTIEACEKLGPIPKPFLKPVLGSLIEQAKSQGVAMIDEAFVDAAAGAAGFGGTASDD